MRKYLVPLLLFSAIGVVIIVLVKSMGDEEPREQPEKPKASAAESTEKEDTPESYLKSGGRQTPTKLSRNRWLSELERVLQRGGDLKNGHYYRGKLCERIDELMEDDVALGNLMAAIRKYAIEQRDPKMRDLLLPILRVLTTPEATQLIEEEYYRTEKESERLILLDAMANPEHNPEVAGVWAAEMAINSEDHETRETAFLFIQNLPNDQTEVVVKTAKQIYAASTRPHQKIRLIEAVTRRAEMTDQGREFIRERLTDPKEYEIGPLIGFIEGWGTVSDAITLEALATRFPAMQDALRERAEKIRLMAREREDPESARKLMAEQEARELERQRLEKEKNKDQE